MGTLTSLSGKYVTFDQNARKCNFVFEVLSTKTKHLNWKIKGLNGLATLLERLDESGGVSFN